MRRISLDAFAATQRAFATAFPDDVVDALAPPAREELSAAYLDADRRRLLLTDLRALRTWRSARPWCGSRCFRRRTTCSPSIERESRWLLPWWYVRRAAEGMWKMSRS